MLSSYPSLYRSRTYVSFPCLWNLELIFAYFIFRKMDGLEEVLGLYATSQPIAVLQQSDNRGQQGRGFATRGRSGQAWSSAGDQQVRIILLAPWYKPFPEHNKIIVHIHTKTDR